MLATSAIDLSTEWVQVTVRSMFLPHYAKEDLEVEHDSSTSQKRKKYCQSKSTFR